MSDASDFEALVREHHPRVIRLCASMLGGWDEAEDAAQEVFLKAHRALPDFRGDASISTWLYRLASNHCLDALRARSRRRTDSWDELLERRGDELGALLRAPDETGALEARDLAAKALSALSPEYRLVLALRELEGLTYEEIAEATGATLDSVKARLRRARAELEAALRHLLPPGGV